MQILSIQIISFSMKSNSGTSLIYRYFDLYVRRSVHSFLSHFLSLSLTFSHILSLSLTFSHFLSRSLIFYISFSHFLSLSLSFSHFLYLSLTFSVFLSLSLSFSHFLYLSLTLSFSFDLKRPTVCPSAFCSPLLSAFVTIIIRVTENCS